MYGHEELNSGNNIDAQFDYKVLEQEKKEREKNRPKTVFDDPTFISKLKETNKRVEENYDPIALQNAQKQKAKKAEKSERELRTEKLSTILKKASGNKKLANKINVHIPANTVLHSQYGTSYKNSMWAWRRASKIKNKKSRLYAKNENYNAICQASDSMTRKKHRIMTKAMSGRMNGCESEAVFHDLSAFMLVSDAYAETNEQKNKELLDNYLGTYNEETGEIENKNRNKALDAITEMMFSIDVSNINFENDTEMIKDASKLENLVNCVGAYDRIMNSNNAYFETMEVGLRKSIQDRMDYLRSVAAYYQSRKDLLSDETYRTHYDHELTMEVNENTPKEQRALAEKLMRSYVLGKNLIRYNSGNKNDAITGLEVHLVNQKSRDLLNEALNIQNKDVQKQYIEKAYASMDYLAAGIQLNANNLNLTGGSKLKEEYYWNLNHNYDENVQRDDLDLIKNKLLAKGLDITHIGSDYKLVNPMTGVKMDALGLDRVVGDMTKRVTARMGTMDIVNMLYGLFAPGLEANRNLDPESEQGKKVNEDFDKAFKTFANLQLSSARSYMNSFGNLPQQLSAGDNAKFLRKYGDVLREYKSLDQSTGQLYEADRMSRHFVVGDGKKDVTRELMFRNAYSSLSRGGFVFIDNNNLLDQPEPERDVHTNITESVIKDPILLTEDFENNSYISGPSMTKKQLEKYEKKLKSTLSRQEYEAYKERRKLYTDTTSAVFRMWENDKLTSYVTDINNLVASENATPEDVMALTRKVDLHIKTLEFLKKKPSWQNPDLEPNAELRKKIILARENENYLIGIKRAINLGYEYKSLEDQAEKQKKKTELDTCLANLKVVNNEYVALARMNSMKEVEVPKDKDYSRQNFEEALIEFNRLDYRQLKFSSYEDIIKNYHHNMTMCYKAEQFQNMMGEAILNGRSDFTDKFMMETRAKLAMFSEVKRTCIAVNLVVCNNPGCMDDPYNENKPDSFMSLMNNWIVPSRGYIIAAVPTDDLKGLYKQYLNVIKEDHNEREEIIKSTYYSIVNKDRYVVEYNELEEMPPEEEREYQYPTPTRAELTQRKNDYQKNQMLHEYFFRLSSSFKQNIDERMAAIFSYCHRNGMEMPNMERNQTFAYLKPQEAIELYKKYVGSNSDKMEYYKYQFKEIGKVGRQEYNMGNMAQLFKGTKIKQRFKSMHIAQNAKDLGDSIIALMDKGEPLPGELGFKDRQDVKNKSLVTQNFFYRYVGRIISLTQMGASKYRGAVSMDDYKNMNVELAVKKYYQNYEPVSEEKVLRDENVNKVANLFPRYNDDNEENALYAKFDTDMEFLYKEEYKRIYGKYPDANA